LLEHLRQLGWNPRLAVLAVTGPFQNRSRQQPAGCLAAAAGDGDEGDVIERGAAAANCPGRGSCVFAASLFQPRPQSLTT